MSLGEQPSFEAAWAAAAGWFATKLGQPPAEVTVSHALSRYLDHLHANNPEITYTTFKSKIDLHVRPYLGHILVEKLTADDIESWLKKLGGPNGGTVEHRRRRYGANKSRSMLMTALNNHTPKAIRHARAAEWNTVKALKDGAAGAEPLVFDEGESQRFVNSCQGAFRDLAIFCLATGARPASEVARMRVRDFDARTATWTVREGKTGERVVYLTSDMVALLADLTAGKAPGDFVFTRDDGRPWDRFAMQRPFKEAAKRAKLDPEASPYVWRHTHISVQLLKGAVPALVAQQSGTSLKMMSRHYAKFMGEDVRERLEQTEVKYGRAASNVVSMR